MKMKLLKVSYVFMASWVLGEVCKASYFENLNYSIWAAVAAIIALGIHQDIGQHIKGFFHKEATNV